MNQHTFTPGPWRIDPVTRLGEFPIAAGDSVSSCEWVAKADQEANARAIAALPDLVAALEMLVGEADLGEVDLCEDDARKLSFAREVLSRIK